MRSARTKPALFARRLSVRQALEASYVAMAQAGEALRQGARHTRDIRREARGKEKRPGGSPGRFRCRR